ncbi:tetratricopeptide (TPR) repeat protein [Streptomyces sp. V4I23]|uniref:hypothetical protein n=1 Tax=Streptomyces sp. V4I23 TaxID=3042282 RepID=UPI00278552D2|nr:hypothetical protein [Streptomyces sp. V4I23]MDQ1007692.1 tetratricopeptide (TPR) repeat protein [Streptomyces sp. V4I23]
MTSYTTESLNALSFPGFPEAGVDLVIDAARHSAACLALTGQPDHAVVRVPEEEGPADFATMSRVLRLVAALSDAFDACLPGIREEVDRALGIFEVSVRRNELGGLLPLTQSATLGVTRRINRESHDSAVVIDGLARTLAAGMAATSARRGGLTLLVDRIDLWDRPSLRVLLRTCRLASRGDFTVLASSADWHPLADDASLTPLQRLTIHSRSAWLARISSLPGVVTAEGPTPPAVPAAELAAVAARTADRWHALRATSFPNALLELGNALAFQNFEHFFLVADAANAAEASPERRADIERLVGIAESQLGRYDDAAERLERARRLTTTPAVSAHLAYLVGLLRTKRNLAPEEGARHYAEGLAVLHDAEDTPHNVVERSWILNGKALVETMRARRITDPAERREALDTAFTLCFSALDGIKGLTGEHADYLRFNLVANITFLLEITKRPAEAARFWTRAFAGVAKSGATAFLVPHHARLAQLLAQADDPAAHEHFAQAITYAKERGDRFYEERIRYAHGYAAFRSGDFPAALQHFRTGAHLAAVLRDRTGYLQHVFGALATLVEAGSVAAAADLAERSPVAPAGLSTALRGADGVEEGRARLVAHGVTVSRPSPKLPPYIAHVDLEGEGEETVNNLLVRAAGGGHD